MLNGKSFEIDDKVTNLGDHNENQNGFIFHFPF